MSKTTLFDSRLKKYAYREAAQLYGELGSSPAGLSPEPVEQMCIRDRFPPCTCGWWLVDGLQVPVVMPF